MTLVSLFIQIQFENRQKLIKLLLSIYNVYIYQTEIIILNYSYDFIRINKFTTKKLTDDARHFEWVSI